MVTVKDILAQKGSRVVTVQPGDNVLEAARQMNAARIGAVVVVEPPAKVVGIFTERDILTRVVAESRPPAATRVSDVMSPEVACCRPATSIEECRGVMTNRRLRHLPVVEDGELVGIISIGDIVARESAMQQSTIEYLHEYMYGRR